MFLFDDIGEDFHGDEYDKQSQILDPTKSGFIERSTFLEWYRKLSSQRVSESKDDSESQVYRDDKIEKRLTAHSSPKNNSSTTRNNCKDTSEKSHKKNRKGKEHLFLEKEIEIAKKYEQQGKYDEAEPIFRKCLLISEGIYGPRHSDTLSLMSDLASIWQTQEEYGKAESLFKDCLEDREASLGPDHQDTLISMKNLADSYRLQKKYDKAEKLYNDCFSKMKNILGSDHHYTLLGMHGLGSLYFDKVDNTKAEAYLVIVLQRAK